MDRIIQAVIAGAGNGTRLFERITPGENLELFLSGIDINDAMHNHLGKSWIRFRGKPLVSYLLEECRYAGIKDVIILAKEENEARYHGLPQKELFGPEGYHVAVVPQDVSDFLAIYSISDQLHEWSLNLQGHHFIPRKHLSAMLNPCGRFTEVMTAGGLRWTVPHTINREQYLAAYGESGEGLWRFYDIDNPPEGYVPFRHDIYAKEPDNVEELWQMFMTYSGQII